VGEAGSDQAAEAFGREPVSFWRRQFLGVESAAPKRVTRIVAGVSGLVVLLMGGHGLAGALVVVFVLVVPGAMVERFFKARRRRRREELLPGSGGS
jgi:hypothetical protein